MALIKSKQIVSLLASKVETSEDKMFLSSLEKDLYSDKYTVEEVDALIETSSGNIEAVREMVNSFNTELNDKIASNRESLTQEIVDTKEALEKKISNAIAGIVWKQPVESFDDIEKTYPEPQEGFVVSVEDTNKVYRYDDETAKWVEFPIPVPRTYSKTVQLKAKTDGSTTVPTGIRNDGAGLLTTNTKNIQLFICGVKQVEGVTKSYTSEFVNNELIITWNNKYYTLEMTDQIEVVYTHIESV